MYAVATGCCLDVLAGRRRRALPVDLSPSSTNPVVDDLPRTDVAWLGPCPDDGVDSHLERGEAVELAFVAVRQPAAGRAPTR